MDETITTLTATTGAPGADSSAPVTHQLGGKTLIEVAAAAFGRAPAFWGRYFTNPTTRGSIEYRHEAENACLREAGVRVLPIARQTNRVAGTADDGLKDGCANAADLIASFGAEYLASLGGEFFIFLDVEGAPSLSASYYRGWVRGLASAPARVALRPCLYATQADAATWSALASACEQGATCAGVWVAHWSNRGGFEPLPDWSTSKTAPFPPVPAPVLLWQYSNNAFGTGGFDCNQSHPGLDLDHDLLRFLVLPPE